MIPQNQFPPQAHLFSSCRQDGLNGKKGRKRVKLGKLYVTGRNNVNGYMQLATSHTFASTSAIGQRKKQTSTREHVCDMGRKKRKNKSGQGATTAKASFLLSAQRRTSLIADEANRLCSLFKLASKSPLIVFSNLHEQF